MPAKRDPRHPTRSAASPLRRPRSLAFRKLRRGLPLTVSQQRSQTANERPVTRSAAPTQPAPALPAAALPAAALPALPPAVMTATTATAAVAAALPSLPSLEILPPLPAPVTPNALILRGDYWQISYGGCTSLVQDCRGLRYIAILIRDAHEGRGAIHARELVALATGQETGPIELEGPVDLLDGKARAQLVARLTDVAADRDRAVATGDLDRAAALDEEHERIAEELARAATPRGARRRGAFSDAGEKARKAVGKAITEAVERIAQGPGLEPLARHLGSALRKGLWLSYAAATPWHIELPGPLPRK
ncbi:MAG TPA: hypothetical protein VN716_14195 [Vicinamibacterales bacterium]|nr:hypothetical protein [Vicinamibacterales bacterium]